MTTRLGAGPAPNPVPRPGGEVLPLDITLAPQLLSVDEKGLSARFDVVLANPGGMAAEEVAVSTWLRSAHAGQDAEFAQLIAGPPNAFAVRTMLAPGEQRRVNAQLTLALQRTQIIRTQGRPYCVPMVIVDVRYRMAGARRAAAAFMLGEPRGDGSAKLAPLFLDRGARQLTAIEARRHRLVQD